VTTGRRSTYTAQSLTIARDLGDREGEGIHLGNLGLCCERLGDYRRAIDLHTQALALDRGLGNRHSEGSETGQLRTVLPRVNTAKQPTHGLRH
jgi:hypothetical protein